MNDPDFNSLEDDIALVLQKHSGEYDMEIHRVLAKYLVNAMFLLNEILADFQPPPENKSHLNKLN